MLFRSGAISALDGAKLVLKADANETQANVVCPLEVLDPWLDLQFDYANNDAKTAAFTAQLHNSQCDLASSNLKLNVNGNDVEPTSVRDNGDNTYSICIDSTSVVDGAIVTAQVSGVKDNIGNEVEVSPVATPVQLSEQTRNAEEIGLDIDYSSLFSSVAQKGLASLASLGWEKFYTSVLDPQYNTGLYQVGNNAVLSQIINVEDKITDLSNDIKALRNDVLKGDNATIINNANALISEIKTQETQLCDQVKAVYNESDPTARKAAARRFVKNDKGIIDDLATNLGKLYDLVKCPDASSGNDLISVYDELMSLSYNWGTQTLSHKQSFKNNLAYVWTSGAQMVSLGYATLTELKKENEETGLDKTTYLGNLDTQTKDLNDCIYTKHTISLKDYRRGGDWGEYSEFANYTDQEIDAWASESIDNLFDLGGYSLDEIEDEIKKIDETKQYIYLLKSLGAGQSPLTLYCNTTGTWVQTLNGADTTNKWDKAFMYATGYATGNAFVAATGWKVCSPFMEYSVTSSGGSTTSSTSWDSLYLNTSQVTAMTNKLHGQTTFKQEMESVGFKTAKYLVTSEKYDGANRVVYRNNDWFYDTFEVEMSKLSDHAFTRNKQHYNASERNAVVCTINHINWFTKPAEMFVLKKVTVSSS